RGFAEPAAASAFMASCIGAALREGFTGPLFLAGATKSPGPETLRDSLHSISRDFQSGLFHLELNTSEFVTLGAATFEIQQQESARRTVELIRHAMSEQPKGIAATVFATVTNTENRDAGPLDAVRAFLDGVVLELGERNLAKTILSGINIYDERLKNR